MSSKVPCPECETEYYRSPMASHIYCPECEASFHQEWQTRDDPPEAQTLIQRAKDTIQNTLF